ncbi:MAG: c-type cytochrome [Saprospiraceae bacterium]
MTTPTTLQMMDFGMINDECRCVVNQRIARSRALTLLTSLTLLTLLTACEQQPYQMGERLYKKQCANCHMDGGEGLGALIPPLAGSDYLETQRDRLPCLIRYGLKDTIVVNGKTYAEQMAGNDQLNDIQITNVLNYVLKSWGNEQPAFRFEEVKAALEKCEK